MYLALVCCLLFFFYYSYIAFSHLSAQCIQSEWVCFCWPRPTMGNDFCHFTKAAATAAHPTLFAFTPFFSCLGPFSVFLLCTPHLSPACVTLSFTLTLLLWIFSHAISANRMSHELTRPAGTEVLAMDTITWSARRIRLFLRKITHSLTRCSFYFLTWNLDDFFIRSLISLVIM